MRFDIGELDDPLALPQALVREAQRPPAGAKELGISRTRSQNCRRLHLVAVVGPENAGFGFAELRRLFEHRVEHRRQVAGRGDDLHTTSAQLRS